MKKNILTAFLSVMLFVVSACVNVEQTTNQTDGSLTNNVDGNNTFSERWVESNSIDYTVYNLDEYIVGILGYSDSFAESVDYGIITELYSEAAFKEVEPAPKRKVTIGQEELEGDYVKTYNRFPDYYPLYKYSTYDGKSGAGFSVDESGRVSSYINYGTIESKDETLSDKEYIDIAKDFVDNVWDEKIYWDSFKVRIEKDKEIKGFYTIVFEKYLYDMKTSERIYVQVAYSGEISMFIGDMLGRIPDNIDISIFDSKTTAASVYKKLDNIYSGLSKETQDKYKISYYLPEPVLSVLADGTPCYIYDAEVRFTSVDNAMHYADLVQVVVAPNE